MDNYFALHGPAYAGKTTLAKALEEKGYLLINFTDSLKEIAVRSLHEADHYTSVEEINKDKDKYRAFLIELGHVIGFDSKEMFIDDALLPWESKGRPSCVFDNVRTLAQAVYLQSRGFKIVELVLTPAEQEKRAGRIIKDFNEDFAADLYLNAYAPTSRLVEKILSETNQAAL